VIVELERRNPRFGCPRIALIIARTFGVEIDKDVIRRVLAKHYRPKPGAGGPSWLTFIGFAKDSLWSVDLFRCEYIMLTSHWVLVVMDQFTRRKEHPVTSAPTMIYCSRFTAGRRTFGSTASRRSRASPTFVRAVEINASYPVRCTFL
jgi:hypothetical protein